MLMSNTARPFNKSPVWTNQRSRMLRYLLQPRLQLLLHFHCVICLVLCACLYDLTTVFLKQVGFTKGLFSQKKMGLKAVVNFDIDISYETNGQQSIHWRLLHFCGNYITFVPTGWFWFVLCNRESHSNQAASGKFLRGYKEPLIHGNALGLWCVYTESITVNYWQLWNRLLLQDMEWVQRLQKKLKKKKLHSTATAVVKR